MRFKDARAQKKAAEKAKHQKPKNTRPQKGGKDGSRTRKKKAA